MIFMFAALAQAWNILGGFAGYVSFGNVAFFGMGAYFSALAMNELHCSLWTALALSVLASIPISLAISPVLRVSGHYFTVATLALAELLRELITALNIWGGATGISFPLMKGGVEVLSRFFYFAMLSLMVGSTMIVYLVRYSRIGKALLAASSDQTAAEAVGINAVFYRVVALLITVGITAAVGSVYGYWISFIEPSGVFGTLTSVMMIVMVLLGGMSTIWGPIIGAVVFGALSEVIWARSLEFHTGILGLAMMMLILLLPKGLIGLFKYRKVVKVSEEKETPHDSI
jgi:branched-chain amino acid transport system permease protein